MSSRRGSRPFVLSPNGEELRRSSRERQIKYLSLDENLLIHESEQVQRLYSRQFCSQNGNAHSVNGASNLTNPVRSYALRSKFRRYPEDYDGNKFHGSDEDETENRATFSGATLRRSGRQTLKKSVSRIAREEDTYVGGDDDSKDNSASPSDSRDGFEESNGFLVSESRVSRRLPMLVNDIPKSACSTPNDKTATIVKCEENKKLGRESRRRRNGALEEEMEEDDSEVRRSRVYSLRTNRSQSNFYGIEETVPSSRTARQELHAKICKLFPSRRNKTRYENTSPLHDEDNQPRRYNDDKDKEREKSRSRFLPINFTERDFAMRPLLNDGIRICNTFAHDDDSVALDQEMTFDQVGGLDGHIESLKEIVILPLLYPELFSQFGISASKGVLFHGPPGTGKTLVARALANAGSVNGRKIAFFMRKGADILSKWVGESEDQLRQLFEQAYQMRPAIIFFDEIDGLAPARNGKQDHIHTSIVSTLLALMDGLKNRGDVIVIGATNRIDAIDPALRRPGRFDRELKFSLPDKSSRYTILKIHTSNWKCNVVDEDLKWLADNTPGYCGADLKFLCTEAFLSALRAQFPQIYVSDKKLQIDANEVVVERPHFINAMRRVVPACRRGINRVKFKLLNDFIVPTRQLNDRVSVLLKPLIDEIIKDFIPAGYHSCSLSQNSEISKMEQIVRRFKSTRTAPPCRLLISGKTEDMGQTSYVLPTVLNYLGHLSIFPLSVSRLYTSGSMEEAFSEAIQQAISSSSRGAPAVLVISAIEVWHQSVPPSMWQLLTAALNSFSESTSVLFLATAGCCYDELPREVREIFRSRQTREIRPPKEDLKVQYFTKIIIEPALKKPEVFDATIYPEIPVAAEAAPVHQYSREELDEMKKSYDRDRNELNIHYIDTILRFIRDRRFSYFEVAVDSGEVPDYYDVIKKPMDLSTMLDKANLYKSPEEFLADFALIRDNALEYNSHTDPEGRIIRQMAKALYHKGERAYHEIDSVFLRKLQETEKVLLSNGVKLPGFEDAAVDEEVLIPEVPDKSCQVSFNIPPSSRVVNKRRPNYGVTFGRKRRRLNPSSRILKKYKRHNAKLSANIDAATESPSEAVDLNAEEASVDDARSRHEAPRDVDINKKAKMNGVNDATDDSAFSRRLIVSIEKLNAVVAKAVVKTKLWPLRELELLANELLTKIDEFAEKWNREELPAALMCIINNWDFDAECSSREDEDRV